MPSFGIFGSKKKSKSTLTLAGNHYLVCVLMYWCSFYWKFSFSFSFEIIDNCAGDKWRGEGERTGSSYSLETEGHNRKMISKVCIVVIKKY